MAVKKTATEATESEKTAAVDNSTNEAENTVNGAQETAQTATENPDTVKLIYIGPSLPKAMLKSNKVFEGTEKEIKEELAAVIEKFPLVEKLLVPINGLAEKKEKVAAAGNILNKYYSDLVSAASAALIKEE
jgi:hypothetical protein